MHPPLHLHRPLSLPVRVPLPLLRSLPLPLHGRVSLSTPLSLSPSLQHSLQHSLPRPLKHHRLLGLPLLVRLPLPSTLEVALATVPALPASLSLPVPFPPPRSPPLPSISGDRISDEEGWRRIHCAKRPCSPRPQVGEGGTHRCPGKLERYRLMEAARRRARRVHVALEEHLGARHVCGRHERSARQLPQPPPVCASFHDRGCADSCSDAQALTSTSASGPIRSPRARSQHRQRTGWTPAAQHCRLAPNDGVVAAYRWPCFLWQCHRTNVRRRRTTTTTRRRTTTRKTTTSPRPGLRPACAWRRLHIL
jgi:hypothetical protein